MKPFLQQIVEDLQQEFGADISELCIVVPTRRAVVFLRDALAKTYRQTLWAPKMVTIQDFVREESGWQFPEKMALVFELYEVYQQLMRADDPEWEEPFERFYAWGGMLLRDFDELDKYLVDPDKLFANLLDLKEIDAFFQLPDIDLKSIRDFWMTLRGPGGEPTAYQARFMKIWSGLAEVYHAFQQHLLERGQGYDGMAYRKLIEEVKAETLDFDYRKVVFVGFNALSRAEEQLMEYSLKTDQGIVYWDTDQIYFTPPDEAHAMRQKMSERGHLAGEEPGKFIDEYHRKWRQWESRLIHHQMTATPTDIHITGVPLEIGQSQYLGNLLRETDLTEDNQRDHAIVLADEHLLFPSLYALPDTVSRLNITMGYPLRQTHIYHFLMTALRLVRNMRLSAKRQREFYHEDLVLLLTNPLIRTRHGDLSEQIVEFVKKRNLVYASIAALPEAEWPPLLQAALSPPISIPFRSEELPQLLDHIQDLFKALVDYAAELSGQLELEYTLHFLDVFTQFRDILMRHKPDIRIEGFTRLFQEVMRAVKIPFEGEPLVGVQMMGFLETRVLDFKKVYILSANEGNLPDTSRGNTFIPYNLRRGFGLPTYEEKDAIYAYHFYRLLQRSEEVHLIYNSVVSESGGVREVSRFIRQIRHFFRKHPTIRVHDKQVSTDVSMLPEKRIEIPASEETREKLKQTFAQEGGGARFLSATALTSYLTCSLKFYFRYIAGLKERETVAEQMEANTFGTIFHEAMEELYKPIKGIPVDQDMLNEVARGIPLKVNEAFVRQGLPIKGELYGQNYLKREVIERLCKRVIGQDKKMIPFRVTGLEAQEEFFTQVEIEDLHIRIGGAFDRIDELPNGTKRILDYKTGNVSLKELKELGELFESGKFKEMFQGYLYAWLHDRAFPGLPVKVGYYTAKHLTDGVKYVNQGASIPERHLEEFGQLLTELILQIWNESYAQTEDRDACAYCPYNQICGREA
ncbi:PD-(D/E)XK nuclease family protein [Pontibacter sp. G13]|uniref:PD-(D/E)XK nuclease family protein n=1 Tax=Pontibacter sp. G13 TaxID=3074898 RepID=UPI00288B4480|nr:PD-(D/E)XK nuclease family protein [Pontibacter sp. G13]WNJ19818.1 PD-(D/E)XK nuclease family protein [Pontibacter sp. G13]